MCHLATDVAWLARQRTLALRPARTLRPSVSDSFGTTRREAVGALTATGARLQAIHAARALEHVADPGGLVAAVGARADLGEPDRLRTERAKAVVGRHEDL